MKERHRLVYSFIFPNVLKSKNYCTTTKKTQTNLFNVTAVHCVLNNTNLCKITHFAVSQSTNRGRNRSSPPTIDVTYFQKEVFFPQLSQLFFDVWEDWAGKCSLPLIYPLKHKHFFNVTVLNENKNFPLCSQLVN